MQHDNYLVIIYIDIDDTMQSATIFTFYFCGYRKFLDTENNWFAVVCLVKMTMSSDEVDVLTSLHFQSKLPQAATPHFTLESNENDCS